MSALASLSDSQLVSQVSTILDSKASTSLLRTVGEEYQKPSVAAEYYPVSYTHLTLPTILLV